MYIRTLVELFLTLTPCYYHYIGSIYGRVLLLTRNECQIQLPDYPWLRNPYSSLHAAALTNLGEFTSGMIILYLLRSPLVLMYSLSYVL